MQRELRRCYATMQEYESTIEELQNQLTAVEHARLDAEVEHEARVGELEKELLAQTSQQEQLRQQVERESWQYALREAAEEAPQAEVTTSPSPHNGSARKRNVRIATPSPESHATGEDELEQLQHFVEDLHRDLATRQAELTREEETHARTKRELRAAEEENERLQQHVRLLTEWRRTRLQEEERNQQHTREDQATREVQGEHSNVGTPRAVAQTPVTSSAARRVPGHTDESPTGDQRPHDRHQANGVSPVSSRFGLPLATPSRAGGDDVLQQFSEVTTLTPPQRRAPMPHPEHHINTPTPRPRTPPVYIQRGGEAAFPESAEATVTGVLTASPAVPPPAAPPPPAALEDHALGVSSPSVGTSFMTTGLGTGHAPVERREGRVPSVRTVTCATQTAAEPLTCDVATMTTGAPDALSDLAGQCKELVRALLDKERQFAELAAERTQLRALCQSAQSSSSPAVEASS